MRHDVGVEPDDVLLQNGCYWIMTGLTAILSCAIVPMFQMELAVYIITLTRMQSAQTTEEVSYVPSAHLAYPAPLQ